MASGILGTTTREDKLARLVAVLFLLLAAMTNFGILSDLIRSSGDGAALLANIEAYGTRFELGIVLGVLGYAGFLVVGLLLVLLFGSVSKQVATLSLASIVAGVSLMLAGFARRIDARQLFSGVNGQPVTVTDEWYGEVMSNLGSAQNLILIAGIPWTLWTVCLGWLVYRCGFIPRILGVLMMLGGVFPAFGFFGFLLVPDFQANIPGRIVGIPMFFAYVIGEYGSILWLLVMGTRWRRERAGDAQA